MRVGVRGRVWMIGVALACGLTSCVERLVRVGARCEGRLGLGVWVRARGEGYHPAGKEGDLE